MVFKQLKISKDFSRKYCYASDESSITLTIWTLNKPTWKPQSNKNQTETSLSATFCSTRQLLTQPNWLALLFRHSIINPTKHIFISKIQKKTRAKFKELKTSIEMRWNKWKHLRINFFFVDFLQEVVQTFSNQMDKFFDWRWIVGFMVLIEILRARFYNKISSKVSIKSTFYRSFAKIQLTNWPSKKLTTKKFCPIIKSHVTLIHRNS